MARIFKFDYPGGCLVYSEIRCLSKFAYKALFGKGDVFEVMDDNGEVERIPADVETEVPEAGAPEPARRLDPAPRG
jgi:hypothetical protein